MGLQDFLDVNEDVRHALAGGGGAVVALESTIITHGMPFPQNLETAQQVEADVCSGGAVPATIAIIDGRLKAGLSADELEYLAREGHAAQKVSRRDLAPVLANKALGGTTVATTMMIAEAAGIEVFATGGIGGVHRGADQTFDISADLEELSRTRVAVVCAGAKSILDLPKTLEVLETNGVPVVGFGTDEFPAFYARSSGLKLDRQFDTAADLSKMIGMQFALGLGGVLVANPIPEVDALEGEAIEKRIAEAIGDAGAQGISRKDVTPYLLQRIFELTEGKSLEANIALVRNNARLAADIATALSAGR